MSEKSKDQLCRGSMAQQSDSYKSWYAAGAVVLLAAVYTWLLHEFGWFTCVLLAPTPDEITWSNSNWQEIEEGSLFILSAYEDRRFQPHYVRIMGMESLGPAQQTKDQPVNVSAIEEHELTCVLWYDNGKRDVVAAERRTMHKQRTIYDGSITYMAYLYSCPIPAARETPPSRVSLTFDVCERITNVVNVTSYGPSKKLHDPDQERDSAAGRTAPPSDKIALCLKPLNFPTKDIALRLAEWIEIQRLQGVDVIFTYVYDVTDTAMVVLRQYQQRNIVDFVIAMLPDRLPGNGKAREKFLRRTSMQLQLTEKVVLNDCFYRHLAYDYVSVIDLDEVIVPRQHHTLTEMLDNLRDVTVTVPKNAGVADGGGESQLAPPCASYCFRQSMFLDEFHQQDHDDIPEYLHVMQHTNRSMYVLTKNELSVKSLCSTRGVIVLGNHGPYQVATGYKDRCYVNRKMALLHHYRNSCNIIHNIQRSSECNKTKSDTIQEDNMIWKYLDPVRQRVEQMAFDCWQSRENSA
ncbi:PREDICTED: uncharacterized protein LOC106817821 isoform X2 [Priapulus caudatus]|uniref:Glycosyltransferase family 92 protein n=1 Tax=Priapulus caudatus TaxID=37621 RepID=A0ABM1F0N8_PRICU|nr:PREDICTED: uncharacterized protein LOC106817821 isoform X2 [Priapulus caudatus]